MACIIEITSVLGLFPTSTGLATALRVTGKAGDCKEVVVSLKCSGGGPAPVTVPVKPDGTWSVDIPGIANAQCACGKPMFVKVTCKDDPACGTSETINLECEQPPDCPCPTVKLTKSEGDCNPDGTRTVVFTAQITLPPDPLPAGCGNVEVQFDFGDTSLLSPILPVTGAPGTTVVITQSHDYATPGTYTAVLHILVPVGCGVARIVVGPLAACEPECPDLTSLVAQISGCAGNGHNAVVNFTGELSPPTTGCHFLWTFGDEQPGDPQLITNTLTISHVYRVPGPYAVAVTAICGPCIRQRTVPVVITPCCPEVTQITSAIDSVKNCAGGGKSALVSFHADTNPVGVIGDYRWDFDDGTVSGPEGATISHEYAFPGNYSVRVTLNIAGCPPSTEITNVTVPKCGGGGGTDETEDEGSGCAWVRRILVLAGILGAIILILAACVPAVSTLLFAIGVGIALTALVAGLVWSVVCRNKPCLWPLLFAWQIALGIGLASMYFIKCCPALLFVGLGGILGGVGLLAEWAKRCKKTQCQVLAELGVAVGIIVPTLLWLGNLAAFSACVSPVIGAIVGSITSIVGIGVAACLTDDGVKQP